MVAATQTANRDVVFPCVPWVVEGDGERISPKPGTWTLAGEKLMRLGVKGIVSCPGCNEAALVRHDMGTDEDGCRVISGFQCGRCKTVLNAKLQHWDTRRLFCVVYEQTLPDGTIVAGKDYTHAETRIDVLFVFATTHKPPEYRVIDVGQVVGYFGKESDKDQTELSV